jgi:hypothetical protein
MKFSDLRKLIALSYGEESRPGNWADKIDPDFLEDLRSRNIKRQAELWMQERDALDWRTFLSWFDSCYNFCGLEEVWGPDISGYQDRLTYCNTGDSYAATLAWDHEKGEFLITTTGDWQEFNEPRWLEEAWEDSLLPEFQSQLTAKLGLWSVEGPSSIFKELFDQLCRSSAAYPYLDGQCENTCWSVDWSRLIRDVSLEGLEEVGIEYEEEDS